MRGCAGAREDACRRLLCRAVVTEPRAVASEIGTQLASPSRSDANWSVSRTLIPLATARGSVPLAGMIPMPTAESD